jgi:hypothetical protein
MSFDSDDRPSFQSKSTVANSELTIDNLSEINQVNQIAKVKEFIKKNPINHGFIRKEKGKLPYSVFKPSSESVFFIKSVFDKRPPTAFFPYPKYTKNKRDSDRIRRYKRDDVEYLFMAFKVNDNTHIYNAVVNSFKTAGFQMLEKGTYWNCMWNGYTKVEEVMPLNKY